MDDGSDFMTRRAFARSLGVAAIGSMLAPVTQNAGANPTSSLASPQPSREKDGDTLIYMSAIELVERMRRKDVSAREVLTAHLAQIDRINPKVNAIVTLAADRAMRDAARA